MSTPTAADNWQHRPERSSTLLMRVMVWISLYLGRHISRAVLHCIAVYFLLFSPQARRASGNYLFRILGRPATLTERYNHFLAFATTVHDRIYLLNERFDLFDIRIAGEAIIRRHIDADRGILLMGAHLGSFEVMRAIGRSNTRLRVCMAMYTEQAAKLSAVLQAINPAAVQDIVPLGQMHSMLEVRDRLEAGQMVGLLSDRAVGDGPTPELPYMFLGSQANFPLGPFRMAAMLRRPVVFMTGLYLGENRYEVHFEELADFSTVERHEREAAISAAQARYVARLEHYCHYAPYNWFNYFDFWQSASASGAPAATNTTTTTPPRP